MLVNKSTQTLLLRRYFNLIPYSTDGSPIMALHICDYHYDIDVATYTNKKFPYFNISINE